MRLIFKFFRRSSRLQTRGWTNDKSCQVFLSILFVSWHLDHAHDMPRNSQDGPQEPSTPRRSSRARRPPVFREKHNRSIEDTNMRFHSKATARIREYHEAYDAERASGGGGAADGASAQTAGGGRRVATKRTTPNERTRISL